MIHKLYIDDQTNGMKSFITNNLHVISFLLSKTTLRTALMRCLNFAEAQRFELQSNRKSKCRLHHDPIWQDACGAVVHICLYLLNFQTGLLGFIITS